MKETKTQRYNKPRTLRPPISERFSHIDKIGPRSYLCFYCGGEFETKGGRNYGTTYMRIGACIECSRAVLRKNWDSVQLAGLKIKWP